ncbi:hypothetical protein [Haloarcula argentinensis]|uniref:PGF-CTERM sorting domain-containing protein n=1 Tax=Haloarcula argentinensis TaxID=43776 RepID=A0ABU2F5W2_HALAR|nr:hypothetical protein [Haloarcula argentinensis]EMA25184.1 hypothetical protein C443_03274 [Haloarcula argentinensis DSM 12282]MDS0255909.1 hypothetical protein [Haloarcula argentinensis]
MTRHIRFVAALMMVGLVVCSGGAVFATPAAGADPPPTPAAYYGNVTIDGEPAPAGTEITAKIDGERRGTLVTEYTGAFGGSSVVAEKLAVNGTRSDAGATVIFYVNDVKVNQTAEWSSGSIMNLDLKAPASAGADDGTTDPAPPDEETDGADDSDGGGSPPADDGGSGDLGGNDDSGGGGSPPADDGESDDTGGNNDTGGGGLPPTDDGSSDDTDENDDSSGSSNADDEAENQNVTTETAVSTFTTDSTTQDAATASTDRRSSGPESTDGSGPGFGIMGAVVGVGLAVLAARTQS